MPAIQVARTDTFEQQRQKINQLGSSVFNITAGGSDLSTGNLKLGDGTRIAPSLAFVSDSSLGLYKPAPDTLGFVSDSKKILDISDSGLFSFKNFILQKKILTTTGLEITNPGSNYDSGIYTGIALLGGTGSGAIASLSVGSFFGTITNEGANYTPGSYSLVQTTGGSGSGSVVSFTVDSITGSILSAGSGYPPGSFYDVPITGGNGTGAIADIVILGQSNITGTITPGSGYTDGTYAEIQFLNVPTTTYTVTTIANPGTPPPAQVYRINGNTQQTLNLLKGNTYKFDLSDSSVVGHPLVFKTSLGETLSSKYYTISSKSTAGTTGACVYLIIDINAPTESIKYECSVHSNMGGTINVASGSVGRYGKFLTGEIVVSGGSVSGVTISSSGQKYKANDTLEVYSPEFAGGAGTGFVYTISSIVHNGTVQTVTFSSIGSNYLNNDILSINNSFVGGFGSGLQYRISSKPRKIRNLQFITKGSGYNINDIISISGSPVTNISTVLNGEVSNITTTLSSSSPIVTLTSTTGILAGMTVSNAGVFDIGFVGATTTVLSVDSSTQITLSIPPISSGAATLYFRSSGNLNQITVSSTSGILVGSSVSKTSGPGVLSNNTTVTAIDSATNTITLSANPITAGAAVLSFAKPYGTPTTNLAYTIASLGSIDFISILDGGAGYSQNDILTVNPEDLTQPIQKNVTVKSVQIVTFTQTIPAGYFQVGDSIEYLPNGASSTLVAEVYGKKTSGANLVSLTVEPIGLLSGIGINKVGQSTTYTVNVSTNADRFFIDDLLTPNLTLYVGDTYQFNISDSSNSNHNFSLSEFRDGIWAPSYIQNISTTLSDTSNEIIVANSTGILPGMEVTSSIGAGSGVLQISTKVASVPNSTTVVLDKIPAVSGSTSVNFRGTEYLTGAEKTSSYLRIKIITTTPTLYYYCSSHVDEGGSNPDEAVITINQNNPKVFGSNFQSTALTIDSTDIIQGDIQTGEFIAETFTGSSADVTDIIASNITTNELVTSDLTVSDIISGQSGIIAVTATSLSLDSPTTIGPVSISNITGNITTAGQIKTTGSLNINDVLSISNSTISTSGSNNITLSPASGRVAKINANTAIIIPSGNTSERPVSLAEDGAIRFNTQTNQYEGYSGITSSWSSLGGVRDLDGNTFITAELTIGSNDNTLRFYNDNINTVQFTPEYQEFVNVKKVRSLNTSAPTYINWTANTPVTTGQYLKYRNNIYEVVTGGVTGSSGNEPTNTTGTNFTNGTTTLVFYITSVAPLTFEEISEVRIAPLGGTSLVVNDDLTLSTNTISTKTNDLAIQPNSGKKVIINAATSLVLPVGTSNERGNAIRGSVRYNSTILQYEGYDGSNWSSLGGVRDVDGNTYIIPEISAGSDENTLYFYNNGSNTLRVTTSDIELYSIDTISSPTSNTLNLDAQLITFNNVAASIDTSSLTTTFISTTKDNLDFGLSSGLTNDPLLRLSDTGDIYYNLGFGTGVYNGLKILDTDLKQFELSDYKIVTSKVTLTRNTVNSGSAVLYDPAVHASAKVQIIAHNEITGDKEFIEYSVIDKGADLFYTDFGNVKTGAELISCVFDFNSSNNARVTFTLDSAISSGNVVKVTVISNIIKR